MQRVSRSTAVAALPAPPATPSSPGFFTGGNPASGLAATVPGYEWFNTVQEELVAIATCLGATLNPSNYNQVLTAIRGLIQGQTGNYGVDTGTSNTYAVTLSPAPAALTAGLAVRVKIANTNTTASSLNVTSLGSVAIHRMDGTALQSGDLVAGETAHLIFDGTYWQLVQLSTLALQQGVNYYVDSGSVNSLLVTLVPQPASLVAGLTLRIKVGTTNTSTSSLNINGVASAPESLR